MEIRKSTERDFERMMEIYACARDFMAKHGNPNQWGPTRWPPEPLIHLPVSFRHHTDDLLISLLHAHAGEAAEAGDGVLYAFDHQAVAAVELLTV